MLLVMAGMPSVCSLQPPVTNAPIIIVYIITCINSHIILPYLVTCISLLVQ